MLALYGRGTVLRVVQQAAGGTDPAALVTTTPPAPPLDVGSSLRDPEAVLTAVLAVRGGQLLSVGTGPSDGYGFTVACTGTRDPVTVVVFVDGIATAGDRGANDQGGQRPCEGTVRDGANGNEVPARSRKVELSVLGPESALVTVGVYKVAVDLP